MTSRVDVVADPSSIPERVPSSDGKQMDLLLSVVREEMAEAFKAADTIDTKARSAVQIATIFFAASQAAVGVIFTGDGRPGTVWVLALAAGLGLFSLGALVWAARSTMRLNSPDDQAAVDVVVLREQLAYYAERGEARVSRFMLDLLTGITQTRREANETKAGKADSAVAWAYAALYGAAAEILIGMLATIAG
jgi:hypothetical protein